MVLLSFLFCLLTFLFFFFSSGRLHTRYWRDWSSDVCSSDLRLPLLPIQLPQERPQSLDERILEQRFAIRFRNEETVQPHVQRFRDFLESAEAGRHLPAFDPRQIGARDLRPRLQLALGHRARFAQLANPLPDVLHGLLVDKLLRSGLSRSLLSRLGRRNQELQALR